ncbi:MAG TPA: hypothetical protein VFV87_19010, partial [Pirellulaceae bacterium]|nr:hypothetical protein [Pirellulaceae bacterium]
LPAAGGFTFVDSDNNGSQDLYTSRSSDGNFSWMATLVPNQDLHSLTPSDVFTLSVVVCHQRPLVNFSIDTTTSDMYLYTERVAQADFTEVGGTGYGGGEMLLIWPADGSTIANNATNFEIARQTLKARSGDWIMLGGFAPRLLANGAYAYDVPVFKWYRVTEADHEPEYHPSEQHYAVAVSLSGQDWDTSLCGIANTPGTNAQATLMTGVVAVYEKSIRLETGTDY